ncbi:MAG TPA: hypothetical protein PK191_03250 [Niabella sp.]|nr:hypothetical protein [Niabella sp.]HOZ96172.1 hypothetical protein [Niabella sp.]HQW13537.1 hypothetical protein [Niabella sp.]HQX18931.1 hypothetical protein [Niabella sp.]HQX40436.1 hypothetical protein [Niabella sp.]
MKKYIVLLMIGVVVLTGCKNGCGKKDNSTLPVEDTTQVNLGELPDTGTAVDPGADSVHAATSKVTSLTKLTKEVLTIFKNKDYAKLEGLIHPDEGVRFSPYATVDFNSDKQFLRSEFTALVTRDKNKKMVWGSYDGSGDPINLTPEEYFNKFVYDANFVNPEKYAVDNIIKTGNSVNNLKSIYEGSNFTESNFSGSKKNSGIDWKSVRLVFKQINGKYYLVGIVHDQWTI